MKNNNIDLYDFLYLLKYIEIIIFYTSICFLLIIIYMMLLFKKLFYDDVDGALKNLILKRMRQCDKCDNTPLDRRKHHFLASHQLLRWMRHFATTGMMFCERFPF